MSKELRYAVTKDLRAAGTDQSPKIQGYAATFGQIADLGQFRETIQRGAFKNTLASDTEILFLFNHDDSLLLGRRSAGNLTLTEDEIGLKFSCSLADTSVAKDVYENLKAGNLRECSFGFYADGEQWSKLPDGTPLRTLTSVKLFDVSVVSFPAYQGTSAIARNVVPADVEKRMTRAMSTDTDGALIPSGGPVSFSKHAEKRDDEWNEQDAVNGIVQWASEDDRSAGTKINSSKLSQGFAYVSGEGRSLSDYQLPHHVVVDGKLAHHFTGSLRALGNLASGKTSVPAEHRAEVRDHLIQELQCFQNDDSDSTEEVQRSRARLRLALAK
jgi:HK97 family phage prohead protease